MLAHRLRSWPNIGQKLGRCVMFAGLILTVGIDCRLSYIMRWMQKVFCLLIYGYHLDVAPVGLRPCLRFTFRFSIYYSRLAIALSHCNSLLFNKKHTSSWYPSDELGECCSLSEGNLFLNLFFDEKTTQCHSRRHTCFLFLMLHLKYPLNYSDTSWRVLGLATTPCRTKYSPFIVTLYLYDSTWQDHMIFWT